MSLWDTLKKALTGGAISRPTQSPTGDPDGLIMYFRCKNCGADVAVRLNKRNDLSREDGGPGTLFVRKEVMDNRCFRLMRAEVWLDDSYNVVTADIEGGNLLTRDEYEARQARPAS